MQHLHTNSSNISCRIYTAYGFILKCRILKCMCRLFVLQAQCYKCLVQNFILRHSTYFICSTHSVYIYFSSSRSYSYSSGGPPGGGCCTVCSHLAPAEVSSSLSYNDGLSSVVHNTGEQNLVVQCNTHYMISEFLLLHNACMAQKCRPGFSRALCSTLCIYS